MQLRRIRQSAVTNVAAQFRRRTEGCRDSVTKSKAASELLDDLNL